MSDKGYLTGLDLLEFLNRLDYSELLQPIGVSETVTGVNKPYLDDTPITYAVRISSVFRKSQNFNGWVIEGLPITEIKRLQKEYKEKTQLMGEYPE